MLSDTKSRLEVGDGNILLNWGVLTVAVAIAVWIAVAVTNNPASNGLQCTILGHPATSILCAETPFAYNEKPLKHAVFQRFLHFDVLSCDPGDFGVISSVSTGYQRVASKSIEPTH